MPIIDTPGGIQAPSLSPEEIQAQIYEYWSQTGLLPGQIPPPPPPPPPRPPPEDIPPSFLPPGTYPPSFVPSAPPISGQITGVGEASNIWIWAIVGLIIIFLMPKKKKKGK